MLNKNKLQNVSERFTEFAHGSNSESLISHSVFKSKLISSFLKFDSLEEKLCESAVYRFLNHVRAKYISYEQKVKRKIAEGFEKSYIVKNSENFTDRLLKKSLKYYGVLLFFFGIFIFLFSFLSTVNSGITLKSFEAGKESIGLFLVLLSTFFMTSRKSIATHCLNSRLISYLAFDLMCFDRKKFERLNSSDESLVVPIIVGMLFGCFGLVISPVVLFELLFIFFFIISVLKVPENGIISSLLILPFANIGILVFAVSLCFLSYFLKVIRNKRVFRLGLQELLFTVLLVFSVISQVFGISSGINLTIPLFLVFGFVISNTVKTSALIEKCINSILISVSFVSIICIIVTVLDKYELLSRFWLTEMVIELLKGIPFSSVTECGELILFASALAVGKYFMTGQKPGTLLSLLLFWGYIVVSGDVSLWFSMLVVLLVAFCCVAPKLIFPMITIAILGGAASFIFGSVYAMIVDFIDMFSNYSEIREMTSVADSFGIKLFSFAGFSGIFNENSLDDAFISVFGKGIENVWINCTLTVKMLLLYGIIGFVLFLISMCAYISYCMSFYFDACNKNFKLKSYMISGISFVVMILFKGLFFPTMLSYESVLLFVVILFLSISVKKSSVYEYDTDVYEILPHEE